MLIINIVQKCYMAAILVNDIHGVQVGDLIMCVTHCAVLVEDECRTV